MANYIDAFIIPVPKKYLKAYEKKAKYAASVWIKHGAIEYVETVADDVQKGKITSFPRSVLLKSNEVAVLAYVVYKSKASREQVMKKVMKDEELMKQWEDMPVDGMRMIFGGFKTIVVSKKK